MIALCFCKFTLIYYFIYMNLPCSPSTGQCLGASMEASCHVYVLSILAKSPSQRQMLRTYYVLKGVILEESGYRGTCRYTHRHAAFHCFKALWLTSTMACDERQGALGGKSCSDSSHWYTKCPSPRAGLWGTSKVLKGWSACLWNVLPLLSTIWVFSIAHVST